MKYPMLPLQAGLPLCPEKPRGPGSWTANTPQISPSERIGIAAIARMPSAARCLMQGERALRVKRIIKNARSALAEARPDWALVFLGMDNQIVYAGGPGAFAGHKHHPLSRRVELADRNRLEQAVLGNDPTDFVEESLEET